MKRELHVITTGTHSLHDLKERLVQIHPYVDFIHIREKERSAKEVAELILQLVQSGVPKKKIVVNDRVDVAFALEVAGVQLAYHSLNPAIVRRSFPSLRIGRSVHSLDEAIQAEKEGADYCIYGHIFETSSKEGRTPKGVEELKLLSSRLTIPVIAIGGIKPQHIPLLKGAGVGGVAVLSGILKADNPLQAVKAYREQLNGRREEYEQEYV
ncbi:thiazole tautomerase TenI [Bacillus kexueae]|uniref:thiazole tautomerase TenI n=1 Tax=Aeribacillus kexueae TaxID=2078952 RepID=UPI001FAF9CE9|nr:thiazole tautomerase TenI [Bacillus kexueae]